VSNYENRKVMIMSANWAQLGMYEYECTWGPAGRAVQCAVRKSWWYASCTGSDTDTENTIGAR
jgi:hypothetical protein